MIHILRSRKGSFAEVFKQARLEGFSRVRVDGEIRSLDEKIPLDKKKKHTVELVVDRLTVVPSVSDTFSNNGDGHPYEDRKEFITRLTDSIETALRMSDGMVGIDLGGEDELLLSDKNACPECNLSFPDLHPSMFSFNSPMGMCPECNGLGTQLQVDIHNIIVNPDISLLDGASRWHGVIRKKPGWHLNHMKTLADHYGVDLELPWKDLPEKFQNVILYGSGNEKIRFSFENRERTFKGESFNTEKGAVYHINRLFHQTSSEYTRRWYMSFLSQQPCQICHGQRLRPEKCRHCGKGS